MSKISVPQEHIEFADDYLAGYERGFNAASWCDEPEIGERIPRHIDWVGYGEVSEDNIQEVHEMLAFESESASRDYSPFEFTAHDLNKDEDTSEERWEAFDAGIADGIRAELAKRYQQAA